MAARGIAAGEIGLTPSVAAVASVEEPWGSEERPGLTVLRRT
jgi:hypothetical protein